MQPFSFEIFNLRAARRFLKTQGGYISTISAVCDKDAQETIEALPEVGNYTLFAIPTEIHDEHADKFGRLWDVMREICLEAQVSDDGPKTQPEQPKEKGQYGYIAKEFFSNAWYRADTIYRAISPFVYERIQDAQDAKVAFKASYAQWADVLNSSVSMTEIGPESWLAWAKHYHCEDQIKQMLKQAGTRRMEVGR